MNPEARLARLLESGVLEEAGSDEALQLTEAFERAAGRHRARIERTDGEMPSLPDGVDSDGRGWLEQVLADPSEADVELAATYLALVELTDGIPSDELVPVLTALSQLQYALPDLNGVPETFLPVPGTHLKTFLQFYHRAIVYVWREDCDPCDVMRDEFDDMFATPPDDVALFAVYGPDTAEHLREEYDVVGAPTTLFVLDGGVDSRLIGPHYREVIENEVEILRDQ